jgi:hypothetical protein
MLQAPEAVEIKKNRAELEAEYMKEWVPNEKSKMALAKRKAW